MSKDLNRELIRPYQTADAQSIADLYHRAVHAVPDHLYSAEQREAWAPSPPDYRFWEDRLSQSQPLVAEREGRVVGFLELEQNGHIDCLYVDPLAQRQGIASALLAHARGLAAQYGLSELRVEASLVARPYFLKAGFQIVRENLVQKNGQRLTNFSMVARAGLVTP